MGAHLDVRGIGRPRILHLPGEIPIFADSSSAEISGLVFVLGVCAVALLRGRFIEDLEILLGVLVEVLHAVLAAEGDQAVRLALGTVNEIDGLAHVGAELVFGNDARGGWVFGLGLGDPGGVLIGHGNELAHIMAFVGEGRAGGRRGTEKGRSDGERAEELHRYD